MNKYRKFLRELERRAGVSFTARLTNSGHLRLQLPNGATVNTSATPSCPYTIIKVVADLKRAQKNSLAENNQAIQEANHQSIRVGNQPTHAGAIHVRF